MERSVHDQAATAGSLTVGLSVTRASVSKAHVSPRDRPFVIGLEHQRADEADDGLVVGE